MFCKIVAVCFVSVANCVNKGNTESMSLRISSVKSFQAAFLVSRTSSFADFSNSFKYVKNNFFHIRIEKPKNDIEKALFVSIDDLMYALERIKSTDNLNENQVLRLDENEINNAYEQIVK